MNYEYSKRRKLVWELADKLNCDFSRSSSGMFVWAKIKSNKTSIDYVDTLLNEKGIFIAPGSIFGLNGEGYVRISLCNSKTNIKKAILRL